MRSRQTIEDCLDCGMNRPWKNAAVKSRPLECVKRIVTGKQLAMDGSIQQLAQLLPPFFLRIGGQTLKRLEHQVPVFFHAVIQRSDIEKKRTTARKFENSIQNGPGRRNVAMGKIFLERGPRYRFRDAGMRRQRSQLGSEDKSIARARVKEWLLAKPIPAAKKLAARAIVNRISPHAVETLGQS